ncbi:protein kinase [Microbispora sp. RL4-1S]|uniref:non-specific serine/threonine protein kinase n=1 Tax=Microbispora oryzae TaxID=2806554 RepID=A0A940WKE1_9ACTN|nr:serine/threonine-protein kinase [Microbispora oryzae]MBP2707131.1 protein kinase [Microbispora oryzae]
MRAPPGYLLAARYRLVEPVGRGGMGTVWRARDELLDRDVAVKEVRLPLVLDEELRAELCARTEREGRATAMVAHPSVITVFDVITEDDRPWIVMELLKARSLEELIKQEGPLPPRQAAEIGRQVLGALRAVHAKGILHRDVKPSNVLVTEDRAVLTDFGLAALEGDASITQAGIVLGSAGYIAPERVLGDKASPAADLWSLGATLYTAVEGRGLHGRRTAAAALAALTSGAPIPMEKAGPLAPVLRGLLQIDPATRLDGVRAALALARIAAGGTADDLMAPPHRPARPAPPPAAPPVTTRKPPHRGQHRAESRPTPKVMPHAHPRDGASGPHAQFGHQHGNQFGSQYGNQYGSQYGSQYGHLGPFGSPSSPSGPYGQAPGQPPQGQPGRPGQQAYPGQSGQHAQPGQHSQSGPYGQSGQYSPFGQYGQHGQSGPYGQYGQTGSFEPSGPHPFGPGHSGPNGHLGHGPSYGHSGPHRRLTRDPRNGPEYSPVPPQRRRPAEGMHRKPSEPGLHQVVAAPVMRRLASMIKMVLPRRYWPRIFLK